MDSFKKKLPEVIPKVKICMEACPCRKKKGYRYGWCGVAGGGVPACDH